MVFRDQGFDDIVVKHLGLNVPPADLTDWEAVVAANREPEAEVLVAMVGKYVDFHDSYKSLNEALVHAGIRTRTRVRIRYVESQGLEAGELNCLQDVDAILVPGGFGDRGFDGKIRAVQYAREHGVPYLGICLGLHAAVVEFARNVAGLEQAHSTEFEKQTPHPVIGLITEWQDSDGSVQQRDAGSDLGGTMRLGAQECRLSAGTLARKLYEQDVIHERHRHRYEFNNRYTDQLTKAGLVCSGYSVDGLVEMIELPNHPWFVASQFHPEFTSSPRDGHPVFTGFIRAARQYRQQAAPRAAQA
jgi:CTP synthase